MLRTRCRSAWYSKWPKVYIHFASKDAVLHAINELFYEGMTAAVSDVVDELLQTAGRGELMTFEQAIDGVVDASGAYAKANARATRNATFWPLASIPPATASAPMITAVRRATRTSAAESVRPRRKMLA